MHDMSIVGDNSMRRPPSADGKHALWVPNIFHSGLMTCIHLINPAFPPDRMEPWCDPAWYRALKKSMTLSTLFCTVIGCWRTRDWRPRTISKCGGRITKAFRVSVPHSLKKPRCLTACLLCDCAASNFKCDFELPNTIYLHVYLLTVISSRFVLGFLYMYI